MDLGADALVFLARGGLLLPLLGVLSAPDGHLTDLNAVYYFLELF